jgi:5'-methylthioadenosine phosphorylase
MTLILSIKKGIAMQTPTLAVIGGSGLYEMPGLHNPQTIEMDTPFGKPSAPIIVGTLEGIGVAFLARHGIGHHLTPSEIPFRANLYALKSLGVERVVSISACGSLREDYAPGDLVIPDQLFDFTRERKRTFFEDGLVVHISVADPFCPNFSEMVYRATRVAGTVVHNGGALITIEGPRFSTKAESSVYRQWGMAIIGMTASPEAFLAREAELCYAVMAHVTDYDVWHVNEQPVTVDQVIQVLNRNTSIAQQAVKNLARELNPDTTQSVSLSRSCECPSALASALITRSDVIPAETRQRLDLLVGKYLKS